VSLFVLQTGAFAAGGSIYSPAGGLLKSSKITQLTRLRRGIWFWPVALRLRRRPFAKLAAGDFLPRGRNKCLGAWAAAYAISMPVGRWLGAKNNFENLSSWRGLPYFRHNWGA